MAVVMWAGPQGPSERRDAARSSPQPVHVKSRDTMPRVGALVVGSVLKMRVHVTGGTGFLGSALRRRLPDAHAPRVEVRDPAAVKSAIEISRPDVVIHTAYRQDGPDAWAVNVEGSVNVARHAAAAGARLIHLSTDVVFDGTADRPYREDDPVNPITDYGRAKAAAEWRVLETHPDALVVRTSLILGGPGNPPSKHEIAARDPAATFFDDEVRSPILVSDLVDALVALAGTRAGGVLHVAGVDHLSRAELASAIAGHPVRSSPAPPGRPRYCALDSSAAIALLGVAPRGLRAYAAP